MDDRLSARAGGEARAARRRLIYMLLRNGDIGVRAGGSSRLRASGPTLAAGQALSLPALDADGAGREPPGAG